MRTEIVICLGFSDIIRKKDKLYLNGSDQIRQSGCNRYEYVYSVCHRKKLSGVFVERYLSPADYRDSKTNTV